MIDVYSWTTPNGHKVHIMLEEIGLDYTAHPINIGNGDQFQAEFLKISPNNKIPAIVDQNGPGGDPISVFESGAILIYLAEKTGQLMPADARRRVQVLEWLMFQMGGIGPMLGQAHHFIKYAPQRIDYAVKRYSNEANRLYGVLDKRLSRHEYVAADEYTIADIAIFPWLRSYTDQGVELDEYANVRRWFDAINERPAVKRGLQVLAKERETAVVDEDKAFENMFGAAQYQRR